MLVATVGRCCSPACRRLWATTRRHRNAATAAMQQQQQAAALQGGAAAGLKDQDRLQLDVEDKLGIPREIYEAVSRPPALAFVCRYLPGKTTPTGTECIGCGPRNACLSFVLLLF